MQLTTQVKTITGWRTIAGPTDETIARASTFAQRAAEVYSRVRVVDDSERVILTAEHVNPAVELRSPMLLVP